MAAKNLPVVGEAFLGTDPMAVKCIRVACGHDTTEGINDVILAADTTPQAILTVSDSKFMLVDIKFRITAAFSAANDVHMGPNSSPSLWLGASASNARPAFNAVGYQDMRLIDTTSGIGYDLSPLDSGLTFPQDSSDNVVIGCAGAATSNGDMEVYFFYVETP